MRVSKEIFLTLLLVMLSNLTEEMKALPQCDAESQVKLSLLAGLKYHHYLKTSKASELRAQCKETEATLAELETALSVTLEEEAELQELVHNMTTAELEEMEAMYTCESSVATDCCQIKRMLPSAESGLYAIRDPCSDNEQFNNGRLTVNCDMDTDGGGWTVIQRRNADLDRVNFTRSWEDYDNFFGDLDGEFWIGLKNIYELTNQQEMMLRISVWNDTKTSLTRNYPFLEFTVQIIYTCSIQMLTMAMEMEIMVPLPMTIRESVDSLCRDGADTPMPLYIGKAFTRTNFEDSSLFRYMIMVCE